MTKYQVLKGMSDILPEEIALWQRLEDTTRNFFRCNGYEEIRTPIMEKADLFQRSIGESSDIVHKEMYTFEDRGGRLIALRPEMTASVVRAVIERGSLKEGKPHYLYYWGPMFRAERPQAGRRRQFHQVGIEVLNAPSPFADAETIALLVRYLEAVGLKKVSLTLNTLGCPDDQVAFRKTLRKYFSDKKDALCEDCCYRLDKNVLRIFDCKNTACHAVIDKAPAIELCERCKSDFDTVLYLLDSVFNVTYKVNHRLVRGLDYYTGCVFEATSAGLGAKDAVVAGGRYDGLVKEMGGPDTPATGFAVGIERLLESMKTDKSPLLSEVKKNRVYIAFVKLELDIMKRYSSVFGELALAVRSMQEKGCEVFFHFRPGVSLKAQLREADKWGTRTAIIIGEDELSKGVATLRDFELKKDKSDIKISDLATAIEK